MSLAHPLGCSDVRTVPTAPTGTVSGTVRLVSASDSAPTPVRNTTDPEVCGETQSLEDFVVSAEGGLGNAFVSILIPRPASGQFAGATETAPETVVIDNVGCRFEPHAAVLTVGSTLMARNSDAVLHTTHLYGPAETNFSLPIEGATGSKVLDVPGIYSVKCDVHGWMQAFVRVDAHPFHDVTDHAGFFEIGNVPVGTYTMEVWHERLGPLTHDVVITEDARTTLEVNYEP